MFFDCFFHLFCDVLYCVYIFFTSSVLSLFYYCSFSISPHVILMWNLSANSQYHAVPVPCRSANGLDCVFPIWFTQCGHVWFTHAMPFPCHATNMPFWKWPLKGAAQRGMGTTLYVWISIGRPETACGRTARVRWMQGRGRGTAWYVWIRLNRFAAKKCAQLTQGWFCLNECLSEYVVCPAGVRRIPSGAALGLRLRVSILLGARM
jgi:hypothetical protein